jgi:hypothetical protein
VYRSSSRLFQLAAPILVAVAIAGYLAGHRHSAATSTGAHAPGPRIAYGPGVLLEYPAGWQATPATAAPAIPGLSVTGPLLLAPGGNGALAGLLSGQVPAGQAGPLPSTLMTQLRSFPHAEVVDLLNTQSYRYSQLSLKRYTATLELYVIPSPGSKHTVLACYAATAASTYLRQCQQIVAGLTLVGEAPTDLAPEAAYAAPLERLIGTLDLARVKLRRSMRASATQASLGRLAGALANAFAAAAASLTALEPPPPASSAQAALVSSIVSSQHTYEALSTAVLNGDQAGYASAQAQLSTAEAGVNTALQSFALLGYGQAQ